MTYTSDESKIHTADHGSSAAYCGGVRSSTVAVEQAALAEFTDCSD